MIRTSAIISDGSFPCATAVLQGPCSQTFRQAKEAGFDCVQLTIKAVSDYDAGECRRLMEQYSLQVSAMATGRIYTVDGLSMGSSDEENRAACVQRLRELADFSCEIGKPAVVIGAVRGLYKDAVSPEEYHRQFDRSVRELLEYCEPLGVPVILEADDHLEADAFCDPEETLEYVRSFHSPVFYMYLDTMHLFNEGLDAAEVIRAYGKEIFSIDISGEDRLSPVLSKMDFRSITEAVCESGFDGVLTFEMPPSPPVGSAAKSLEFIKQLLSQAKGNSDGR